MYLTLTPAYGRDYKSQKEVKTAWETGADFIIADMFHKDCGRYINLEDAQKGGIPAVCIRFANLRKIAVIEVQR